MDTFEKGMTLPFVITRELTLEEVNSVVQSVGKFGLQAAFEAPVPPTPDILLKMHLEATSPTNDEDFIGKEHFLEFGENEGYSQHNIAHLFKSLVMPLKPDSPGNGEVKHAIPIEPQDLGLVVCSRASVIFPNVPEGIKLNPTRNSREPDYRTEKHKQAFDAEFTIQDLVIQIKGLRELARKPELVTGLFRSFREYPTMLKALSAYLQKKFDAYQAPHLF